ncbi:MAG: hypothetical protein IJV31_07890 [Clostridia bacterium]|nr:hypothetical protein [Clostridia bacterium]
MGNLAYLLNTQGANILLNIFFGVGINAARGIAVQVNHTISNFVNSFMTAINPQITKSYAEDNLNYMHTLICRGAKYSFFVMLFFAIPIGLETPILLKLWLKIVPDSATIFVRLILISALCTILGNTLYTAQLATGNIKKYQISVSLFGSLVFPLTWLAFKLGAPPAAYYYIYILIYFLLIFIKIYLVQELIKMSWKYYIKEALIPAIFVALISCIPPIVIYIIQEESIWRFFEIIIISTISTVGTIYYLGLDFSERKLLINQIKKGLRKK